MTFPFGHNPERLAIPPAGEAEVLLDFDGTITQGDVLDELVMQFAADDSWQEIERLWQTGRIGSRECLGKEFALLRVEPGQLEALLDRVKLDPGVKVLLKLLKAHDVPVAIVSDGIDLFIERILSQNGISGIQVRANAVEQRGNRLALKCPHGNAACESEAAHCKCESARQLHHAGRRSIYVGDGRSDLCPARKADTVFAKGALASNLTALGIPSMPFSTLDDVVFALNQAWSTEQDFSPAAALSEGGQ